jgi:glutathione S-transferase
MLKLYTSIGPNPRVVRMFAVEKVDIIAGACRQEPYLSINPMGSTPALVLPSGQAVTEVLAICEYLEEVSEGPALIGSTPESRAETRMWTRRIDLEFATPLTLGFRAAEGRAMFEPRMPVVREAAAADLKGMAFTMLDRIEPLLAKQAYVVGDRITLADILLFCFVDFGLQIGSDGLTGRIALSRWHEEFAKRPSAQG